MSLFRCPLGACGGHTSLSSEICQWGATASVKNRQGGQLWGGCELCQTIIKVSTQKSPAGKKQKRNENNTKSTHLLQTQNLPGTVPGAERALATEAKSGQSNCDLMTVLPVFTFIHLAQGESDVGHRLPLSQSTSGISTLRSRKWQGEKQLIKCPTHPREPCSLC